MKITFLTLYSLLLALNYNFAQKIKNPSFEGTPAYDAKVTDWIWCNNHSTPDIQPSIWEVTTAPQDGNTYIGLTCRSDGTWESIEIGRAHV